MLAQFLLKVVATLTESNTASTATPARRALVQGTPSFSKAQQLGIDLVQALGPSFFDFGAE
ncbi:hypothetical protein [Thauera humireducens]|uniref:hypothetical protein n=1 Tax=Thauera humireducens TaxID=1134435 RepID=UPI0031201088